MKRILAVLILVFCVSQLKSEWSDFMLNGTVVLDSIEWKCEEVKEEGQPNCEHEFIWGEPSSRGNYCRD